MNRAAYFLIVCVSILFLLGLLMVFNTTSAEALDRHDTFKLHLPLIKQMIYGFVGMGFAYYLCKVDYQTFYKTSYVLFWVFCIFLVLVFVPGIGLQKNGAQRWIGMRSLSFQPSEFMKILMPTYYLAFFTRLKRPLILKSFLMILATLAIPIVLILFEPDNGSAGIMLVTLVALFYLTKVRWVYWGLPLLLMSVVGGIFASKMKHVTDRIRVYLNPELDLLGKGHQPYQAKIAAGSGGLFGRGLGESMQKFSYLPEARSDYIAAIYAEELGFMGIMLLVTLYMCIGYFGFKIAAHCKDKKGFYLASILTFIICFQAFLNLGVVSGLLPSKGTNLPFFSHGGSSLIANMMVLGMILSVAKKSEKTRIVSFNE
ncbi:MAG: putative peptidoglycan glycosyltransferase FtsW [Chlamydiia bacterium]|nr:putative peptidoglycan glycosyltransferase FtsW [Chlamydiia bacterium]